MISIDQYDLVLVCPCMIVIDCSRLFTLPAYPCKVFGIGPSNFKRRKLETVQARHVVLELFSSTSCNMLQPLAARNQRTQTRPETPQSRIFYWTEWEAFVNLPTPLMQSPLHSVGHNLITKTKCTPIHLRQSQAFCATTANNRQVRDTSDTSTELRCCLANMCAAYRPTHSTNVAKVVPHNSQSRRRAGLI